MGDAESPREASTGQGTCKDRGRTQSDKSPHGDSLPACPLWNWDLVCIQSSQFQVLREEKRNVLGTLIW